MCARLADEYGDAGEGGDAERVVEESDCDGQLQRHRPELRSSKHARGREGERRLAPVRRGGGGLADLRHDLIPACLTCTFVRVTCRSVKSLSFLLT
eukprot:1912426-Pleurochrysis_carterae.AAC.1